MATAMDLIFNAILEDDGARVARLLKANPAFATAETDEAKLFQDRVFHWIYVGDTALHLAAAGHRAGIAKSLIAAGADPNAAENMRKSRPLHYAADGSTTSPDFDAARQVKTIECLLRAGADIHAQDKNGATALHRAVRTRCAAAASCLLKAGADPTMANKPGSTPFHLAVQNTGRGGSGADAAVAAQRKIINMFLAQGVSPKLKDGRGKSVLECTRSAWIRELLV